MKALLIIVALFSMTAMAKEYVTVNNTKNPVTLKGCSCNGKGEPTKLCPKVVSCLPVPAKNVKKP